MTAREQTPAVRFDDLPLRQRKQARTRYDLLQAALARLPGRTLDDINVKELCADVGISEASFFNYYPRKVDLLVYYVQLWSLEAGWHAARAEAEAGPLAGIGAIYDLTARRAVEHPDVFPEVIAFQARMTAELELREVTLAERLLAFPELPGIEDQEGTGLDTLLPPLIARAIAAGELPAGTDPKAALLALASIFFGVPLLLRRRSPRAIGPAFRDQLSLIWAGLRTSATPGPVKKPRARRKRS